MIKRFIYINSVKALRFLFNLTGQLINYLSKKYNVTVVSSTGLDQKSINRICKNLKFYVFSNKKEIKLIISSSIKFKDAIIQNPILIYHENYRAGKILNQLVLNNKYFINPGYNPTDAWEWSNISVKFNKVKADLSESKKRFNNYLETLYKCNFDKAYIFGTGPSLELASERNWEDGYRVVCNTIVRDKALWNTLLPHFIVAADGLYHFSNEEFAIHFRNDLYKRLEETSTMFLYPEIFHPILINEAPELGHKFLPVKVGQQNNFCYGLNNSFELPALGNVLNLMLLPLACTLSKNVFMWGFDGRSPNDKFFWSNSNKHSYPEYFEELVQNHPAFFGHFVPDSDPNKYVKEVHGDTLENNFRYAESMNWKFIMMHHSWTTALQNRFKNNI